MLPETKEKLKMRLDSLQEALTDCRREDAGSGELAALFCVMRDMQPGLCEVLAEVTKDPDWAKMYREKTMSEEEQRRTGYFLWEQR